MVSSPPPSRLSSPVAGVSALQAHRKSVAQAIEAAEKHRIKKAQKLFSLSGECGRSSTKSKAISRSVAAEAREKIMSKALLAIKKASEAAVAKKTPKEQKKKADDRVVPKVLGPSTSLYKPGLSNSEKEAQERERCNLFYRYQ